MRPTVPNCCVSQIPDIEPRKLKEPTAPTLRICCAMMKDRKPNQVHGSITYGAPRAFAYPALADLVGVVGT